MPKDNSPKKGKSIKNGHRDDRIKESSGKHLSDNGRQPYKNTIKHDTEPSKNSESFKKK